MNLTVWGTRGSFAAPGAEYVGLGGNTTCIEITAGAGRLIIDLGTGSIPLAASLVAGAHGRGASLSILLSHTHIDHIQGLPFFSPFFIAGNRIRILGPSTADAPLEHLLQQYLRPHHSPLHGLENLAATVTVDEVDCGTDLTVEGFTVRALPVLHGHATALGFRISDGRRTVAIMTDVDGHDDNTAQLATGADLLIHGATILDGAQSSIAAAIALAERAHVPRVILTHFAPGATDAAILAAIAAAAATTSIAVSAARESFPIPL